MRSSAACRRNAVAWLRRTFAAVILALAAFGLTAAAQTPEKRTALVIGNARYPAIPLNNPENDARVMASTLRRLGFDVTEHVNLPVKRFRQVLRDYVRRLQNEDGVGLLYYAGHGVQIDGRNYLLPVDINLRDEEEIKDEAVDIDDLFMSKLGRAKTKGLIVILDACRDNPFRGKTRNIQASGGLAEMGAAGAFIAYSAGPGATAEDGPEGNNSVFTRHLAIEMLQRGMPIETTFKNVRLKVLRDTNKRQMPWVNSSLTVDFQFNPQPAVGLADGDREADLKRLQEKLDRREQEQRRLEDQLRAMQRRLDQAKAEVTLPHERPADATGRIEPSFVPRAAQSEVRRVDNTMIGGAPQRDDKRLERRDNAPVEPRPAETPDKPADRPAVRPPAAREPGAIAESKKPAAQVARTEAAANLKRTDSERCVALQIRATLGEPVSAEELQKECRR